MASSILDTGPFSLIYIFLNSKKFISQLPDGLHGQRLALEDDLAALFVFAIFEVAGHIHPADGFLAGSLVGLANNEVDIDGLANPVFQMAVVLDIEDLPVVALSRISHRGLSPKKTIYLPKLETCFMRKSIIIICASIFILVLGATCESTVHDVGPYTVSVDAERDVSWSTLDPIELVIGGHNATMYSLNGYVDAPIGENHVTITIGNFNELYQAEFDAARTAENMTSNIKNSMALIGAKPISISPRIFDGYQGLIGVSYWGTVRETLFEGQWLTNSSIVTVTSNIRWGEGTQQIFDSIHIIEKGK